MDPRLKRVFFFFILILGGYHAITPAASTRQKQASHPELFIMAAMMAPTPPSLAIILDISSFAASVKRAQHACRCNLGSPGNA